MGLVGDLALGFQDLKCLPNWYPTDVEAFGELLLTYSLSWLQLARHNGTSDLPENRFLGSGGLL
jgi:hypothetical protein